jgi:hypothetical protein
MASRARRKIKLFRAANYAFGCVWGRVFDSAKGRVGVSILGTRNVGGSDRQPYDRLKTIVPWEPGVVGGRSGGIGIGWRRRFADSV